MASRCIGAVLAFLVATTLARGDGGCCLPDDNCQVLSFEECVNVNEGNFLGEGTDCTGVVCAVIGACCFSGGACMDLEMTDCANMGGAFQGVFSDCGTAFCPEATGACCVKTTGQCIEGTSQEVCEVVYLGIYQDDDTTCSSCPAELEACCLRNGTCVEESAADCTTIGGTPQGPGSTCATIPACTPACPEDTNGDGDVGILDFLDLLADWGPCPAPCNNDIDGDGAVGIVDFLALLAAWGPCN